MKAAYALLRMDFPTESTARRIARALLALPIAGVLGGSALLWIGATRGEPESVEFLGALALGVAGSFAAGIACIVLEWRARASSSACVQCGYPAPPRVVPDATRACSECGAVAGAPGGEVQTPEARRFGAAAVIHFSLAAADLGLGVVVFLVLVST